VGRDLAPAEAPDAEIRVSIESTGSALHEASGLCHMLQQYFEQMLADSPAKRRLARELRGAAIFRAAEDEAIQVCIRFCGNRIELSDVDEEKAAGIASITADFLTIAHLASGQETPFALLARRRLRVRFRVGEIPFLLRMLGVMRSADVAAGFWRLEYAVPVAAVLAVVIYILL